MEECTCCRIIRTVMDIEKDYFIAELKTGYAIISNRWQYFKGYSLFICKECVGELHELSPDFRREFLFEMTVVAEALYTAVSPIKINYELLGNDCKHLHWHIIPRYGTDPMPQKAIWNIDRDIFDTTTLDVSEIIALRDKIRDEIVRHSKKYGVQCTA